MGSLFHLLASHAQRQCDLCGAALLLGAANLGLFSAYWWTHP
jgi:hypothetical protein